MKTKISLVILSVFGLLISVNTEAQTNTIQPRKNVVEQRVEQRKEFRQEVKETVQQNSEARKDFRQEVKEDIKENRQENLEQRKDFRQDARARLASSTPETRAQTASEIKAEREKMQIEFKAKNEEMRKEIEAKKEEMRKEADEKREEMKKKGQEMREELRKKIAGETINRLANTLDKLSEAVIRYQDINTRIEDKIASIKQNGGKDVSKVEEALKIAKDKASLASVSVENARLTLNQSSTASSTDMISFKAVLKTTEESVKASREATTKAVTMLKGFSPATRPATTTPQI
jgi:hypothetical protein